MILNSVRKANVRGTRRLSKESTRRVTSTRLSRKPCSSLQSMRSVSGLARHGTATLMAFTFDFPRPSILPFPSLFRRRPTPKLTLSPRHQSFRLCSSYHLIRFPREHPQLHRRTRDERRPERPEEHGGGAEEGRTPGHHVASVFIGCLLRRFDVRRVVECWLVTEHAFPRAQNPFPFIRPGARKNRKLFFSADL